MEWKGKLRVNERERERERERENINSSHFAVKRRVHPPHLLKAFLEYTIMGFPTSCSVAAKSFLSSSTPAMLTKGPMVRDF